MDVFLVTVFTQLDVMGKRKVSCRLFARQERPVRDAEIELDNIVTGNFISMVMFRANDNNVR